MCLVAMVDVSRRVGERAPALPQVDYKHVLAQLALNHPNGTQEIRVVRDDDCSLEGVLTSLVDDPRCQVDIRALLLSDLNVNEVLRIAWLDDLGALLPRAELTIRVDLDIGVRLQCPEVRILTKMLVRVARRRLDPCGEVPNCPDIELCAEHG